MIRLSRLKLIFISSLVILAAVFIATIYLIPSVLDLAESKNIQIIDGQQQWILQYDIVNDQQNETSYTIEIIIDGVVFTDSTVVEPGRTYTYIRRIDPGQVSMGEVSLTLYQGDMATPVEQVTYYIDLN